METVRKRMWELAGIIRTEEELTTLQNELEKVRKEFLKN